MFTIQTNIDLEVNKNDKDNGDIPVLPAVNKAENMAGNMQIT